MTEFSQTARTARVIAEIRAGQSTVAQGARELRRNPNYLGRRVWAETKTDVFARDLWCVYCGITECLDAQHRIARGSGGSTRPEISFAMANLITLCRQHHTYVEEHPDWAREHGYRLDHGQTPSKQRVWHGGRWVMLGNDGSITPVPESGAA